MATPPLGWISPSKRNKKQQDAHAAALRTYVPFPQKSLAQPTGGPVKIILTDTWKDPIIQNDIGGKVFTGFHQLTGGCVGASSGNAVATLGFIQRLLTDQPTVAFVPWWPYAYGRTRFNEGDRGQGEGAVDSVMGQTLASEGVVDARESGLPTFDTSDGYTLTNSLELQWSDGAKIDPKWINLGKQHVVKAVASLNSVLDIKTAIINGYPVLDGCENFCQHGTIKGSGADSYVTGHYDGRGGHSTCYLGYWDHPTDGALYLYSNQWPAQTYPADPAGGGRCCVWLPESEVAKLFQTGGGNGETVALSHLDWFPAQPAIIDWSKI